MNSSNQTINTTGSRRGKESPGMASEKGGAVRGFAAMDPNRQREIASKGGKAAHLSGKAHQFTSEEARAAGRKGGQASPSRSSRPVTSKGSKV